MRIGTHNSWTFRRADKWWMRLVNFITKCQNKNIAEQLDLGSCIFDLRLRLDKNDWKVAHGSTTYGHLPVDDLRAINGAERRIYVRVLLEYNSEPKNLQDVLDRFSRQCRALHDIFPNIAFFGGNCKWKWSLTAYDFKTKAPKFVDAYSSMADDNKLNDLWPYLWAKHHNKEYKKAFADTDDTLLMDFIDI